MKRKADDGPENGPKLPRASSERKPSLVAARRPSMREKKTPTWMASYVTKSQKTEKEADKKIPKQKSDKEFPNPKRKVTVNKSSKFEPPSKRKPRKLAPVREETVDNEVEEDKTSLRRKSTVKVDDSPPRTSKTKKVSHLQNLVSLMRRPTELLNSADSFDEISTNNDKQSDQETLVDQMSITQYESKSTKTITGLYASKKHETEMSVRDIESCSSLLNSEKKLSTSDTMIIDPSLSRSTNVYPEQYEPMSVLNEKPKMLEIVICISTSGALREYLQELQTQVREIIWKLQSVISDLRIGVIAHTQGGIYDDSESENSPDHADFTFNSSQGVGHSGTKWLDLGATFSQICAFVDSLEPEVTVYPDYVQDNLEMALWKMQRSMSWSSCSYRSAIMIGRGRPNRTSFYLQKDHWRGWIRKALELTPHESIPVVDWELEAKILAQMAIHVFTIQVQDKKPVLEKEEDEGTTFFRRVAEITNAQHIKISEPERLQDIVVSICCACIGPDLLQEQRDEVRDNNDGLLPTQLTNVFMGLQLHSRTSSLSILPSLLGNLNLASIQRSMTIVPSLSTLNEADVADEDKNGDVEEDKLDNGLTLLKTKNSSMKKKESVKIRKNKAAPTVSKTKNKISNSIKEIKMGRVEKSPKLISNKNKKAIKNAVKTIQQVKKTEAEIKDKKIKTIQEKVRRERTPKKDSAKTPEKGVKTGKVLKTKLKQQKININKKAVKDVLKKEPLQTQKVKKNVKHSKPAKVLAKVKSINRKAKANAKPNNKIKLAKIKSDKSPAKILTTYKKIAKSQEKKTDKKSQPLSRPKVVEEDNRPKRKAVLNHKVIVSQIQRDKKDVKALSKIISKVKR